MKHVLLHWSTGVLILEHISPMYLSYVVLQSKVLIID